MTYVLYIAVSNEQNERKSILGAFSYNTENKN